MPPLWNILRWRPRPNEASPTPFHHPRHWTVSDGGAIVPRPEHGDQRQLVLGSLRAWRGDDADRMTSSLKCGRPSGTLLGGRQFGRMPLLPHTAPTPRNASRRPSWPQAGQLRATRATCGARSGLGGSARPQGTDFASRAGSHRSRRRRTRRSSRPTRTASPGLPTPRRHRRGTPRHDELAAVCASWFLQPPAPLAGWPLAGCRIGRSGAYALCRPTQPQRREMRLAGHHGPKPASFARHVPPVGLVPAWVVPPARRVPTRIQGGVASIAEAPHSSKLETYKDRITWSPDPKASPPRNSSPRRTGSRMRFVVSSATSSVGGLAPWQGAVGWRSGAYALCRPTQPQRREMRLAGHHGPKPASFARHVPPVGLVPAWVVPPARRVPTRIQGGVASIAEAPHSSKLETYKDRITWSPDPKASPPRNSSPRRTGSRMRFVVSSATSSVGGLAAGWMPDRAFRGLCPLSPHTAPTSRNASRRPSWPQAGQLRATRATCGARSGLGGSARPQGTDSHPGRGRIDRGGAALVEARDLQGPHHLVSRPQGVTAEELLATTNWQPYALRGFFSHQLRWRVGRWLDAG